MGKIYFHSTQDGLTRFYFAEKIFIPDISPTQEDSPVWLGYLDPESNEPIFNENSLALMDKSPLVRDLFRQTFPQATIPPSYVQKDDPLAIDYAGLLAKNEPKFHELTFDRRTGLKNFGFFYFLTGLAINLGLINILKACFQDNWKAIFALAVYPFLNSEPYHYDHSWVNEHHIYNLGYNFTENKKLEKFLTLAATNAQRHEFYEKWAFSIPENQYFAVDAQNTYRYENYIKDRHCLIDADYEADCDDFEDKDLNINSCILLGVKSLLPIAQTIYVGTFKRIKIIRKMLNDFEYLTKDREIILSLKKIYFSNRYLNNFKTDAVKIVMKVPSDYFEVKYLIKHSRDIILNNKYLVFTEDGPIYALTHDESLFVEWASAEARIYFDPANYLCFCFALDSHIKKYIQDYQKGDNDITGSVIFDKFISLNLNYHYLDDRHVIVNQRAFVNEAAEIGWTVFIANANISNQTLYDLNQAKLNTQLSLSSYNSTFSLNRHLSSPNNKVKNTMLITFITLILSTHIKNILKNNRLHREYDDKSLLKKLGSIKCYLDKNGVARISSIDDQLRLIFDLFKVPAPQGGQAQAQNYLNSLLES
jgi:hypothetical protein